jgi:hypothetical protein
LEGFLAFGVDVDDDQKEKSCRYQQATKNICELTLNVTWTSMSMPGTKMYSRSSASQLQDRIIVALARGVGNGRLPIIAAEVHLI